jgi:hypothetical protein
MSAERIEPEILAAFLEGRLAPAERADVLRIMSEHPEQYEVFADAAHLARMLGHGGVRPIRRWYVAIPALIAAGLAAVVLIPKLADGDSLSPADLARRLDVVTVPGSGSLAMRLGDNWDQPGWSVTRGAEASLVPPAQAFRMGARATDVEIAIRAQDTAALLLVGAELIQLAEAVDAGAAAAAMYRQVIEAGVRGPSADRVEAAKALEALLGGSPWFDLGAWAEAARVAVAAGRLAFVQDRRPALRQLISRLRERPAEESAEVVRRLESLERALGQADPEAVKELLNRVIVAAGR